MGGWPAVESSVLLVTQPEQVAHRTESLIPLRNAAGQTTLPEQ